MRLSELARQIQNFKKDDIDKLLNLVYSSELIILLGNGGSNSICSHLAQDYTKMLGRRSISFSDPSRLTCYINDFGAGKAYRQFVKDFADKNSLVILISSSGNSQNIINCAEYCSKNHLNFITLSGFNKNNKLRTKYKNLSLLDIWVESEDYGVVECAHQAFLHTIIGEY